MKRKRTLLYMFALSALCLMLDHVQCQEDSPELKRTACSEVKLDNTLVELVICTEHGRIKSFRLKGGKNVLWLNKGSLEFRSHKGWKNYGGNRVWIVPDGMRGSVLGKNAPDTSIDGKSYELVNKTALSLTMQSKLSKATGCILERTITLHPQKAEAVLMTKISRLKENPFPIHVWMFSQVALNNSLYIETDSEVYPDMPRCYKLRGDESNIALKKVADHLVNVIFSFTEWDVLFVWGKSIYVDGKGCRFRQTSPINVGVPYYQRGNIGTYSNSNYMEIESFSPLVYLKKGESYSFEVKWFLENIDGDQ